MKNPIIKTIGAVTLLIIVAYPTYDFVRDFTNQRNTRFQYTHYNFSRYLRHGG